MTSGRDPSRKPAARLAVMLSGGGRTLVNLHEQIQAGKLPATIGLVIASRACGGCDRARERGLELLVRTGEIPADALGQLLKGHSIDYVVLAGYLRKVNIPPGFEHRIVNIHPALLPAFGGPGMHGHHVHEAVLAAGCKVSGCTVHFCDSTYDTGPIIAQRACPVLEGDTPDTLAARVFEQECGMYPEAIALLATNRLRVEGGRTRILPG